MDLITVNLHKEIIDHVTKVIGTQVEKITLHRVQPRILSYKRYVAYTKTSDASSRNTITTKITRIIGDYLYDNFLFQYKVTEERTSSSGTVNTIYIKQGSLILLTVVVKPFSSTMGGPGKANEIRFRELMEKVVAEAYAVKSSIPFTFVDSSGYSLTLDINENTKVVNSSVFGKGTKADVMVGNHLISLKKTNADQLSSAEGDDREKTQAFNLLKKLSMSPDSFVIQDKRVILKKYPYIKATNDQVSRFLFGNSSTTKVIINDFDQQQITLYGNVPFEAKVSKIVDSSNWQRLLVGDFTPVFILRNAAESDQRHVSNKVESTLEEWIKNNENTPKIPFGLRYVLVFRRRVSGEQWVEMT